MHRLAHGVVAPERKRDVTHAATHLGQRQGRLDDPRRLNKANSVVVVLIHPGGHREDIGIKNNVLRRKSDLLREQFVRAGADFHTAIGRVSLACFVKRHHHNCGTVSADQPRLLNELFLALLQADGVHDALALNTFQAGLDDRPL